MTHIKRHVDELVNTYVSEILSARNHVRYVYTKLQNITKIVKTVQKHNINSIICSDIDTLKKVYTQICNKLK